jgi:hypothetical protein
MRRPNLALHPFLDARPIWLLGGTLIAVALVLTVVNVAEFWRERNAQHASALRLHELQERRAQLSARVESTNRQLARINWKKLEGETASLHAVVARRQVVWSQLLADLERVLPWDVRLINIAPSLGAKGVITVQLDGYATGRDAWLKTLAALFADRHFANPVPQQEEAPSDKNAFGYHFQLTTEYWPEGWR